MDNSRYGTLNEGRGFPSLKLSEYRPLEPVHSSTKMVPCSKILTSSKLAKSTTMRKGIPVLMGAVEGNLAPEDQDAA